MAQPFLIPEVAGIHRTDLDGLRRVAYLLSTLLLGATASMVVPLAVAAGYGEPHTVGAFATTMFIGAATGTIGYFLFRTELTSLTRREGFAVVALGWLLVCLIGSLPFVLDGILSPVNAWFETVSGFSGTGSSVIYDVEALPRGILFWRSFTHWLGAMGFLVLYVAVFPLMGVGAMKLYQAEAPGLEVDRLRPRISSTARILFADLPRPLGVAHAAPSARRDDLVRRRLPDVRRHRHGRLHDQEHEHRLVAQRLHRVGDRPLPLAGLDELLAVLDGRHRQAGPLVEGRGVAFLHDRAGRLQPRHRRARVGDVRACRPTRPSATHSSRSCRSPRPPGS